MWPFGAKRNVPGVVYEKDGSVSFELTDEEDAAIRDFFSRLRAAADDQGDLYLHPEAQGALTACALIEFAQQKVTANQSSNIASIKPVLEKALAAAMKAYSMHQLPIYIFDVGCLLEMLGDENAAIDAFRRFLHAQASFEPSDIDGVVLARRDLGAAMTEARRAIRE